MGFVIRALLPFLLFCSSLGSSTELGSEWQEALKSPPSLQQENWENWIKKAASQKIISAEAYFNLAQALWEKEDVAKAVETLLIAMQARNSLSQSWSDLKLLSQIQQSLLNQIAPSDNWQFRFIILNEIHLRWLWTFCLLWLALTTLIFRFGFQKPRILFKFSGALWFLVFFLGMTGDFLVTHHPTPVILNNGREPVPFYSSPSEEQVTELPSGLIVFPHTSKEGWSFVNEPIPGWFEERLAVKLPKPSTIGKFPFDSSQAALNND